MAEKKERGDVSEKKWSEKWILPKFNHEEDNVEASDVSVCVWEVVEGSNSAMDGMQQHVSSENELGERDEGFGYTSRG